MRYINLRFTLHYILRVSARKFYLRHIRKNPDRSCIKQVIHPRIKTGIQKMLPGMLSGEHRRFLCDNRELAPRVFRFYLQTTGRWISPSGNYVWELRPFTYPAANHNQNAHDRWSGVPRADYWKTDRWSRCGRCTWYCCRCCCCCSCMSACQRTCLPRVTRTGTA